MHNQNLSFIKWLCYNVWNLCKKIFFFIVFFFELQPCQTVTDLILYHIFNANTTYLFQASNFIAALVRNWKNSRKYGKYARNLRLKLSMCKYVLCLTIRMSSLKTQRVLYRKISRYQKDIEILHQKFWKKITNLALTTRNLIYLISFFLRYFFVCNLISGKLVHINN